MIYGAAWEGEPVRLFSTRIEGPESTRLPLPDADVAAISSSAECSIVLNRRTVPLPSTSSARKSLPAARSLAFRWRAALHGRSPKGQRRRLERRSSSIRRVARHWIANAGIQSQLEFPMGTPTDQGDSWAPRIAPDGNGVAFYATQGPKGRGPSRSPIGPGERLFCPMAGDGLGRYLAWSPRGDEVWFSATKGGDIGAPLRAVIPVRTTADCLEPARIHPPARRLGRRSCAAHLRKQSCRGALPDWQRE